jgi:hypothetical protein
MATIQNSIQSVRERKDETEEADPPAYESHVSHLESATSV